MEQQQRASTSGSPSTGMNFWLSRSDGRKLIPLNETSSLGARLTSVQIIERELKGKNGTRRKTRWPQTERPRAATLGPRDRNQEGGNYTPRGRRQQQPSGRALRSC